MLTRSLSIEAGRRSIGIGMSAKRALSKTPEPREGLLEHIRTLGDPVLRQQTRHVEVFDERLEKLARLMMEVMVRGDGVGLAANQIGVLSRVMVWRDPENEGERYVFVNPEIVERSEEFCTAPEGCLSVPGATMEVSRSEEVVVEAQDLNAQQVRLRLTGLLARIVQHEIDHLDGCLILDRTTPEEKRRVMKELRERPFSGGLPAAEK
jgi:peptide deformylase